VYTPSFAHSERHVKGTHLGQGPDVDEYRDRFDGKQFIGKGFGVSMGAASPGPVYDQSMKLGGPSYTMVFKERCFPKKVFPGPERVRWISQETARDNMGAFSPGPKYDTRGDISKEGPACSFGVSDREFGEHFSAAQKAQFGTAAKPYTCPGEARFVSLVQQRSAMAGKASPGPCAYSARDDITSKYHATVAVGIHKPVETKKLHPPPGKHDGEPPVLVEPTFHLVEKAGPAVSFTQAERWGGGNAVERHKGAIAKHKGAASADGDAAAKRKKQDAADATPGPGAYAVKFGLTEKHVHGGSFGGLP